MGGRGATSISPADHRRGGKKAKPEKVLGLRVPNTSKEALGTKGKPMSMEKAYENANPYFNPAYEAYSYNCQRCVVAYEMRRRSYDVTAQPKYDGDIRGKIVHINEKTGQIFSRWQGAFRHAKPESVGARSTEKVVSNINNKMKSYGNGSRATIQVLWRNGGGHVFNVENVGGKIKAVDAQTGKSVNLTDYISQAMPSKTNIVRTDNLRPSEHIREFVSPTGWR